MSPQRAALPLPRVKGMSTRLSQGVAEAGTVPDFAGVYRITCIPLRMVYVGQSWHLAVRFYEHNAQLRNGSHMNQRLLGAYRHFGPAAFTFEVLELYHGRYHLDILSPIEQRWMDAHPTGSLFNVRRAGSDAYLRSTQGEDNRPQGRAPGAMNEKDWRSKVSRGKRR